MAISNSEIVRVLAELATLTKLDDGSPQSFRVRAYEAGIHALEDLAGDAAAMTEAELISVKGIGKGLAAKIREYVDTGTMAKLETLRRRFPPAFVELTRIPGMGPKTLKLVRAELGVENLDDLRAAVAAEQLRGLPGLGAKTEENVAKAIERLGLHGKDRRTPIADALPVAAAIVAAMLELPEVERAMYCGSLRRFRDTIGDVDVLVAGTDAESIMDAFLALPMAHDVVAHGETKSVFLTREGLQVDLRVVKPEEFGAAVLYFTGSKDHNIALRQRAIDRGWTLNEYALADQESGAVVAAASEQDIYAALDMAYVAPTLREGRGEVEAAAAGALPDLVRLDDLRGDLHFHTSLSGDGRSSLEEMLEAAAARGFEYLAITDHGEDLAINGATREQMLAQRKRLAKLQERYPGMRLLHGCELNIGRDGGLDYDDEFLLGFDWCVASVHSYFDLDPEEQTERLLAAIRHPAVHVIGHLSGRMIGRRPGIEFDVDAVVAAGAEAGTALEINGALDRLDATEAVLRRARDAGVLFAISTDSHHTDELRRHRSGTLHAQRAWITKEMVVNTWPRERFLAWATRAR